MAKRNYDCHYGCPVEATLDVIGGKWKGVILYHLCVRKHRYNELRRLLPDVTQRMPGSRRQPSTSRAPGQRGQLRCVVVEDQSPSTSRPQERERALFLGAKEAVQGLNRQVS